MVLDNGTWQLADYNDSNTKDLCGLALDTTPATTGVMVRGMITNYGYSLSANTGDPLWIGTSGNFRTSPPT